MSDDVSRGIRWAEVIVETAAFLRAPKPISRNDRARLDEDDRIFEVSRANKNLPFEPFCFRGIAALGCQRRMVPPSRVGSRSSGRQIQKEIALA